MWLTNSSVGRKMVMGITGLFLVLFVTFHVLMNAVALFSPEGYNAVCEFLGANWYAILGTLVLAAGFIIHIIYSFVHLVQFWAKMQLPELLGEHLEYTGMGFVYASFSQVWTLPVYLIGFIALWFHMTHGFWSAFQSIGANNDIWLNRWKATAKVWATVVCLLFAVEAIWFTVQAQDKTNMDKYGVNTEVVVEHAIESLVTITDAE